MEIDPNFENIWRRHGDFSFEEKKTPVECGITTCEYAQAYTTYAEELCQVALQTPTHVTLNVAHLQLYKKYWEWYYRLPKRHRYRVGERGHRCIHAVFQHYYEVLMCKELQLQPPMLYVPAPSLPAPPTKVVKVYRLDSFPIGEPIEDEDDE